jgi:peptide/nickel transport system permease protein
MTIFGHKPNGLAWVGLTIVGFFVFLAIFAPWIAPYTQAETVGDTWASASSSSWMGTDQIGRDMMSRIIYGARMTIGIALATTILSFLIGTTLGLLASTGGNVIDQLLSRIVDIMLSIPLLVFALIILSMFGSSIPTLIITIAILDSTRVFRLARAVSMNIAVLEYVEAAKLRGEGLWWVMTREVLQACRSWVLVFNRHLPTGAAWYARTAKLFHSG